MPYIKQEQREWLKVLTDVIQELPLVDAGELNYIFTILSKAYIKSHGESYQRYNDIVGALEGCKLELYRRQVAVYEELKAIQNGDV